MQVDDRIRPVNDHKIENPAIELKDNNALCEDATPSSDVSPEIGKLIRKTNKYES